MEPSPLASNTTDSQFRQFVIHLYSCNIFTGLVVKWPLNQQFQCWTNVYVLCTHQCRLLREPTGWRCKHPTTSDPTTGDRHPINRKTGRIGRRRAAATAAREITKRWTVGTRRLLGWWWIARCRCHRCRLTWNSITDIASLIVCDIIIYTFCDVFFFQVTIVQLCLTSFQLGHLLLDLVRSRCLNSSGVAGIYFPWSNIYRS